MSVYKKVLPCELVFFFTTLYLLGLYQTNKWPKHNTGNIVRSLLDNLSSVRAPDKLT